MDRETLIRLHLQMGLSPAAAIEPNVLRDMWRQLCLERLHARTDPAEDLTRPHLVPPTPLFR